MISLSTQTEKENEELEIYMDLYIYIYKFIYWSYRLIELVMNNLILHVLLEWLMKGNDTQSDKEINIPNMKKKMMTREWRVELWWFWQH